METNFNFKSSVCTSREQSERLLALGLKKETADCYYWQENDHIYREATGVWHLETLDSKDSQEHFEYLDKYFGVCLADDEEHYFIPAWSLGRLIEMYLERYLSCSMNLKNLTYEWIINEVEIHIKNGDFNKEYLV